MRYQDYIIDEMKAAAKSVFKDARAVPADKLDWSPMDEGRSVLDQCQEMAICPKWAKDFVTGAELSEMDHAADMQSIKDLKSIDECEEFCNQRLDEFAVVVQSLSDDDLKKTMWLPYDGGRDFTFAELVDYPRWNFNYHQGQINYIQTLYGDRDDH